MPRGQPPFLENLRSKNSTHFFKHGEPPKDVQATSRLSYAAAGVPKGVPAGGSSTSGRIAERTGAAPPPPPAPRSRLTFQVPRPTTGILFMLRETSAAARLKSEASTGKTG